MKQNHMGGCQCGKVRFEVALDLDQPVISCNCSRCGRLGSLLSFAPADEFRLISGEGDMTEYQFNKHAIHHLFCSTCGIQSFARGVNPKTGAEMAAVNVRCVDGVDLDALKVHKVNGKDF